MITHREETHAEVTREVLAERVAAKANLELEQAANAVSAFLATLKEALLNGERINLGGLIDLGVVVEPARIRQDPGA